MTPTDTMLLAMIVILAIPYLVWRLGRTERWAPLVVIQILTGITLGPGLFGAAAPELYQAVFTEEVKLMLAGIASWGVILFVWVAGIELDLSQAWSSRRESAITAGFALFTPLLAGSLAGALILWQNPNLMGFGASPWQFILGIGMSCSVTALPILMLFMEKIDILRTPLGQRVLRYASLDDIAIWAVLALVVLDFERLGKQLAFLAVFVTVSALLRKNLVRLPEDDRWFIVLVWLAGCAYLADWAGLHYMVGAFLAGTAIDARWLGEQRLDQLRHFLLLILMPVFFLSTGLRTEWALEGFSVVLIAVLLLVVSVAGKLTGVFIAGRILGWPAGEAGVIGWLLQTKALIMIIFANILLDQKIISSGIFTALLLMAAVSTTLTIPMVCRAQFRYRATRGSIEKPGA